MRQLPRLAVCITALGATKKELRVIPEAIRSLEKYFEVSIWEDIAASDIFDSQPVDRRIASLNWAAKEADIVMAWQGGYNSIELLPAFDEIKVKKNTIFVGYSDNTLLVNALPAKERCRGWQGPSMANWLRNPEKGEAWASALYDLYVEDFEQVTEPYNDAGMTVYQPGVMQGKVWGGNNYTFDLLQGTEFFPDVSKPFILLLEGEDFVTDKKRIWQDFIRNLDSIMLQEGAIENLQGLLVGRFPDSYMLGTEEVEQSFKNRDYLKNVPIIYNFARGYNPQSFYLPIGEEVRIKACANNTIKMSKV